MLNMLIERYPDLESIRGDVATAADMLIRCFENGGKLLLCGNGGSCADCDHIVGELMKGFMSHRPLGEQQKTAMQEKCPQIDPCWLNQLQRALPAISLPSFTALNSAFSNDVNPELMYAQALMGLGRPQDVLICISTSGNSKNVYAAATVAKGLGMTVISLTGKSGGKLKALSDVCLCVPREETYQVQELHLPVYHYLCARIEQYFFEEK